MRTVVCNFELCHSWERKIFKQFSHIFHFQKCDRHIRKSHIMWCYLHSKRPYYLCHANRSYYISTKLFVNVCKYNDHRNRLNFHSLAGVFMCTYLATRLWCDISGLHLTTTLNVISYKCWSVIKLTRVDRDNSFFPHSSSSLQCV